MATKRTFRLKKPCPNCPFRNDDHAIHLSPGRIEEIAHDITRGDGQVFYCHKTLSGQRNEELMDTDEAYYEPGERDSVCAGSLIFQMKAGRVPIGLRLMLSGGEYDVAALESQFPNIIEPEDVL